MTLPRTNASHDFLFAKLHGMWARAMKGPSLESLLKSGTVEQLQRSMQQLGLDASKREIFHKDLILREFNMLSRIASLLDDASAAFYTALLARVYYENLKTMLHYRFFPERESDISWLLVQVPGLPDFAADELLDAPDTKAFTNMLPLTDGITRRQLSELVEKLEKELDIMFVECSLDQIYYNHVIRAASRTPFAMRGEVRRLIALEIDIVDLCMLLRNVKTYHIDHERLSKLWIHGGELLDAKKLDALAAQASVADVVSNLPSAFQRMLSPFVEGELYLSENALWCHLHGEASRIFSDFDKPSRSIAAFPFLVHFETLNIGRVYEGVHFGIPARDMQDMMIGA